MVVTAPRDPATVGAQDAQRDPHGGGLAGAIRPEEAEDVALGNLEAAAR